MELRALVIFSFVISFLLGFPVWWKTTTVYRADLPYHLMEELPSKKDNVTFVLHLDVHTLGLSKDIVPAHCTDMLLVQLKKSAGNATAARKFPLNFEYWCSCTQHWIGNDEVLMNAIETASLEELEDILLKHPDFQFPLDSYGAGKYPILLIHANSAGTGRSFYFGRSRMLLYFVNPSLPLISAEVMKPLATVVQSTFKEDMKAIVESLTSNKTSSETNIDNLRTIQSNDGYQVTFSLLNGDPQLTNINWDIQAAVKAYITPFQNQLKGISEFDIESQVQHFASLAVEPERTEENGEVSYFLRPEALTRFINNAEWNLAPAVSSYSSINFIVYIPPKSVRPLRIRDSSTGQPSSNAFLVPRWGGVLIYNPEGDTDMITLSDFHPIMQVFVAQLRSLIGVRPLQEGHRKTKADISFAVSPTGLTLWELDSLMRKNTYHNLVKTAATLQSLSTMLQSITNMVIEDKIHSQVMESIDKFDEGKYALKRGLNSLAFSFAREALDLAEKSFFDPNMVGMLYFPDDHKYAIYIPLFLPVSMPLVMAVFSELFPSKKRAAAVAPATR